nr:unnamed protein product [Callosobruchus analis]
MKLAKLYIILCAKRATPTAALEALFAVISIPGQKAISACLRIFGRDVWLASTDTLFLPIAGRAGKKGAEGKLEAGKDVAKEGKQGKGHTEEGKEKKTVIIENAEKEAKASDVEGSEAKENEAAGLAGEAGASAAEGAAGGAGLKKGWGGAAGIVKRDAAAGLAEAAKGITGNERADRCTKEGAGLPLTGPEPAFSAHLQKLGIDVENPLCRKCGEAVETAKHVIFDCPALCRRRNSYLEVAQEEGRQVSIVQCITQFAKNLGWDSV